MLASGRPNLTSLLFFALLSIGHTWPLASNPANLSRNDNADTVLNEWTVAWVAHQLPRNPLHLFDANIFYPEQRTLAYSEPLIVPAIMGAPLLWAGASPVLVYNLLVIAGFTLTGWSGWFAIWKWTGNQAAALVAGVLLAFNAHTLTRLPHLQALHAEFIPLALVSLDLLLRTPRPRYALLLAGSFVLQGITSIYSAVFLTIALLIAALVRPEDWLGERARRLLPVLLLAAGVAIAGMVPVLLPYASLGRVRPLSEVAMYSARWQDYLATPGRWNYGHWSAPYFGGSAALFPGVIACVLALVSVIDGVAVRDRCARGALAFGAAGVALSFGPALPGYAALYQWFPLLQGIRNAARFGYLAIVAVALLAGFGVARLGARWGSRRGLQACGIAILILVNLEILSAPIEYVDAVHPSGVYDRLRREPRAVVAEFPLFAPDRVFHNAPYMLAATRHWRPIVNGYSGVIPESYALHYEAFKDFPDADAIEALRAAGVTHVMVHFEDLRAWTDDRTVDGVRHSPALQLLEEDGVVGLYQIALPDR
jgi:hypothetical protein